MPRHRRGWSMRGEGFGGQIRHSTLITSLLEPTLLLLLRKSPSHGYTLSNQLEALGINTINQSVVYRTLRDMEILGWIQSAWSADQTQGPPRRLYQLTEIGNTILNNWKQDLIKINAIITRLIEEDDEKEKE